MFERFTESARQVVVLAQVEARSLRHDSIGTEHLLLGLLRERASSGARVLDSLDFTIEEARDQVVRIVGRGDEAPTGQIPFTPRAKQALELALREALALGGRAVGSEHILLGLLRVEDGVAFRVLDALDVVIEEVRALALIPLGRGGDSPRSRERAAGRRAERTTAQLPFAPGTWKLLALAQDEAHALRHDSIGPEHLLLAVMRDGEGLAARTLAALAITPEEVRAQATAVFSEAAEIGEGQIPFTPRARRALELAQREATASKDEAVAPEHILLGLVRENEGIAVAERVRRELRALSGPPPP